jgi:hypothetical protein
MLRLIRHALRPISLRLRRRARAFAFVAVGVMLSITTAPAALGAGIDPGTLNPVPPDSYSCRATGGGAICRSHTVLPYSGEATGIWCGSGANAVELLDNGVRDVDATRWYDRNLNLTRRMRTTLFRDAYLSNPATGLTLGYKQHNTDMDDLAVPGDFASTTFTGHGQLTINVPGYGRVIKEAGRAVVGPNGEIEAQSGPTDLSDYFNGQTSIVDPICATLGTPNG